MVTVAQIVRFLQDFAPRELAEPWDNVGLLLGESASAVQRLMTCLTVTPESAAEAIEAGAQLIVAHHPILFRGAKRLTGDNPEGGMILALARAGAAVYSPHTSFDNCRGGINDLLAEKFRLADIMPLRVGPGPSSYKIVVFVPAADLSKVADAMFAAGAGRVGDYSECSFRLEGTGTFFGSDATNPTVGQKGRREEVSELRLEMICPEKKLPDVLVAMRQAHSYEEPAYDVYALWPGTGQFGAGRIGILPDTVPLRDFVAQVRTVLPAESIQVTGAPDKPIRTVAVVCGSGGDFVPDALRKQVDVLLTGEARFHDCLAARNEGLALILAGHHATERPGVEMLAELLQAHFSSLEVWASRRERDPLLCL